MVKRIGEQSVWNVPEYSSRRSQTESAGLLKVARYATALIIASNIPSAQAQNCIKFPNGTLAPEPVFRTAPDVVKFMVEQIPLVPIKQQTPFKKSDAVGDLYARNRGIILYNAFSAATKAAMFPLTWFGFLDPRTVSTENQMSPEDRGYTRWLMWSLFDELYKNTQAISPDPQLCFFQTPKVQICNPITYYSCSDGSSLGEAPCVEASGRIFSSDAWMIIDPNTDPERDVFSLSVWDQCGQQTFNQSSIAKDFFNGDTLRPLEECNGRLNSLSVAELLNLGNAIYDLVITKPQEFSQSGKSLSLYPLYTLVNQAYEARFPNGAQSVEELDPCPQGKLPCSEGGPACTNVSILNCQFSKASITNKKERLKPLPPPELSNRSGTPPINFTSTLFFPGYGDSTRSHSLPMSRTEMVSVSSTQQQDTSTVSSTQGQNTGTKSGTEGLNTGTKSGTEGRKTGTRSSSATWEPSSDKTASLSRSLPLIPTRSLTVRRPSEGNCTLYYQYLLNPLINAILGGVSCGPGGSTRVDIRQLGLTSSQAEMIAPALEQLTNITDLIIFGNNIGPNGTKAIADAASGMRRLNYVHAANILAGDEGAKAWSDAIQGKTLTLIFPGMGIGPIGGNALAAGLGNAHVQQLYLGSNNMGADACVKIANAVNRIPLPTLVDLSSNGNNATVQAQLRLILANITTVIV